MLAIANQPLLTYTVLARLDPVPGGRVIAVYQDQTVLSVQPDGSFQRRPAGTDGPWEQATQTPTGLVYQFDHVAYLVPILTV